MKLLGDLRLSLCKIGTSHCLCLPCTKMKGHLLDQCCNSFVFATSRVRLPLGPEDLSRPNPSTREMRVSLQKDLSLSVYQSHQSTQQKGFCVPRDMDTEANSRSGTSNPEKTTTPLVRNKKAGPEVPQVPEDKSMISPPLQT